jgi:hypothetical protein
MSRGSTATLLDRLLRPRRLAMSSSAPNQPGVYAVFARFLNCLADIELPQTGIIYIGLATDLATRDHFGAEHSGFSTLRRSLGAILKNLLGLTAIARAPGLSRTNVRNYRFRDADERRLSEWMARNLDLRVCPYDGGDLLAQEKSLIAVTQPPLNLTGWANPQRGKIKALRGQCVSEAKLR